jgi:hypothetical protein
MSAFAAPDVTATNKAGVLAFEATGLIAKLKTSLAAAEAAEANSALECVKILCEGVDQWIEPYVVDTLPLIMDCLAQPKVHIISHQCTCFLWTVSTFRGPFLLRVTSGL